MAKYAYTKKIFKTIMIYYLLEVNFYLYTYFMHLYTHGCLKI